MPVKEFDELPKRKDILTKGHRYKGVNGNHMVEFHVDDHECLQKFANEKYGKFGGNVSIRAPPGKPVIVFGQDESIYNQFTLGSRQ